MLGQNCEELYTVLKKLDTVGEYSKKKKNEI